MTWNHEAFLSLAIYTQYLCLLLTVAFSNLYGIPSQQRKELIKEK